MSEEVHDPSDSRYHDSPHFLASRPAIETILVGQHYQMDENTEMLLPHGSDLDNGMIVLVESPIYKVPVHVGMGDENKKHALRENRWCRVTGLMISEFNANFNGVYADDTIMRRSHPVNVGWFVKRDSIPENSPDPESVKKDFVEKNYVMDPDTDYIVDRGADLKNGMRVLINNRHFRADLSTIRNPYVHKKAMQANRWCNVEYFRCVEGMVTFMGIYDDGSTHRHAYLTEHSWLVKKS